MDDRAKGRTLRRAGRPRSAAADEAILRATIAGLAEVGFDALTMEGVAARAGVGKTTLYRRWATKEELAVAAVESFVSEIAVPDTGSIEGDLTRLMDDALRVYSGAPGRLMPGLVFALSRNRRLAKSLREVFLAPRRSALRSVLERGVERGELRDDIDYELALDFLGGPLFYRLLITGGAIDKELARGVVRVMLAGLSGAGKSAR